MIRPLGILPSPPSKLLVLTPKQLRAARALLGWPRSRLAEESGVPLPTLHKIEAGETDPKLTTAGKLRRTLEDAGVIFVDPTAEHGPGVILRDEGRRVPPVRGPRKC
jgi:DNA-binding XRE family transcriptional regulator